MRNYPKIKRVKFKRDYGDSIILDMVCEKIKNDLNYFSASIECLENVSYRNETKLKYQFIVEYLEEFYYKIEHDQEYLNKVINEQIEKEKKQ